MIGETEIVQKNDKGNKKLEPYSNIFEDLTKTFAKIEKNKSKANEKRTYNSNSWELKRAKSNK